MIIKSPFPFEIRGKLSTTPEQAMSLFGYTMKPGAKAIIIARRNGNLYIRSLMPYRISSPKLLKSNQRLKKIAQKWSSLHKNHKQKYNLRAHSLKIHSGYNLFMIENS